MYFEVSAHKALTNVSSSMWGWPHKLSLSLLLPTQIVVYVLGPIVLKISYFEFEVGGLQVVDLNSDTYARTISVSKDIVYLGIFARRTSLLQYSFVLIQNRTPYPQASPTWISSK